MRRHSAGRRPATTRRKLVWADSAGYVNPVGFSPGTNVDLLSGYRAMGGSTQGITIIRTHISFGSTVTAPTTAQDGFTVGVIVDDNSATSVTLNPTKANLDWMILKTFYTSGMAGSFDSANNTFYAACEIDLRAKRKAQELQQTLFLSLLQTTAVGIGVSYHARVLLALP